MAFSRTSGWLIALTLVFAASCAAPTHRADSLATSNAVHGLTTLEGEGVDLTQIAKNHEATVLFWWATTCPCVRRYEERMAALRAQFPADKVAMYAVASNADDDVPTLKKVSAERGFELPILFDRSGTFPEEFGVKTTPSAVVLDRGGKVSFVGWIDNEHLPGTEGREPYVEDAVTALMGGREVAATRSPMYGCRITRRIGEAQSCVSPPEQQFAPNTAPTCH